MCGKSAVYVTWQASARGLERSHTARSAGRCVAGDRLAGDRRLADIGQIAFDHPDGCAPRSSAILLPDASFGPAGFRRPPSTE